MSDAVEYRLAILETYLKVVVAAIFMCSGVAIYGVAELAESPVLHVAGLVFVILGGLFQYRALADNSDGRIRRAFGIVVDWSRPPLVEWGDKLHDKGAFSYQDELVADGGDDEWE